MHRTTKIFVLLFLIQSVLFSQSKQLTLDDLFTKRELYGKSLSGVQWIPGEGAFTFLKFDPAAAAYNIMKHDIKSGEESLFVNGADLKLNPEDEPFRIQNYKWSPDGKYILFTGVLPARTVKSGGTFYLYNVKEHKFFIAAESEQEQVNAAFSPDGKMLGYVRGNNLWVTDIEGGKETQLTFDGSENILNGVFDWVYEEEFSIIVGWDWSPDSRSIAFWRLDQTNVPEISLPDYDSLYMQPVKQKYPKAGGTNSIVQIGVVDISTAKTVWMNLGKEKDIYIPRMKFTRDPSLLSIQRLNRMQNKLELLFADTRTGETRTILTETSDAWVDVYDDLYFLSSGKEFVWSSARDGWQHLYLYDMSGRLVDQITKGEWEINSFTGADENKLYFTANERGTIYSDFYSVNKDGSGFKRLTEKAGTHFINFSSDSKYFIDRYNTANSPSAVSIYSTSEGKLTDLITPDLSVFDGYNFAKAEFIKIKTSDGEELNARIMKPADFDPSHKYPVIFDVYGGPGSSSVTDMWTGFGYLFNQLLLQKGFIIFTLDNRGTGNRGTAFRHIVYKNLGKWEANDMVEGAKYLIALGYADRERIGIMGASYGGYTSALCLLNAPDYFKAAIVDAAVSDWRYYDDIYTERYMQTPGVNPEGYEQSSLIFNAEKLKGSMLIIHGMSDDNVHFQNAVKLSEKLIENNKPFEQMFYPGQGHGVHGNARKHYCLKVIDFFEKNLNSVHQDVN